VAEESTSPFLILHLIMSLSILVNAVKSARANIIKEIIDLREGVSNERNAEHNNPAIMLFDSSDLKSFLNKQRKNL
jgi:hypothetical protein